MSIGASPVQNPTGTSGGGTSMTITMSPAPTLGNIVIQCIGGVTTNGENTPTLTNVTGWAKIVGPNTNTNAEIWAGMTQASAGTSLVTTANTGHSYRGSAAEWNGCDMTSATGVAATATSTTTPTTGSITPIAGRNALLIAVCAGSSGSGSTPTNGFTALATANTLQAFSYLVVASTSGSYSTGWTYSAAQTCDVLIAVFYAPVGGRLFLPSMLDGLGAGGPFFRNALSYHRAPALSPTLSLEAYRRDRARKHLDFMARVERRAA